MKIRNTVALVTLATILFLSGCATYPARDEYASRLADAQVFSGEIADQTFALLETGKWVKYELGGEASVMDFGNGKTFFAAFEIRPNSMPRRLELRSAFNTFAQARGHVVVPTVRVLDADFNPLVEEESDMRQSSAPDASTEFAHEIDLNADARYIIVYTNPSNVDREIPWHFSLYLASPVKVGTESNTKAKVGVGGPMRIRVHTDTD